VRPRFRGSRGRTPLTDGASNDGNPPQQASQAPEQRRPLVAQCDSQPGCRERPLAYAQAPGPRLEDRATLF